NIDKDHQEIDELIELFTIFKKNTKGLFVVNQSNTLAKTLSANPQNDFGFENEDAGYSAQNFDQNGLSLTFDLHNQKFQMTSLGRHSVENAAAA
ncbi:MAG TPA: UDP-N-acetylmuramate--alanine ligase, partial [Chryseobacterium sp.]|nr:UDP-N-acetylmuramate--alanine ligase [Chryseobacterium sp.]